MTAIFFPILISDITDEGLRRIESGCRAERLRRATAAAGIPERVEDPEDAALRGMTPAELAAEAERLDAETGHHGLCDEGGVSAPSVAHPQPARAVDPNPWQDTH